MLGNRLNSISADVIFVFGIIIFCLGGGVAKNLIFM